MQEIQGSLLYIELDCPASEEAIEVLLDDEDDFTEAVEEDESKCFGSPCLDLLKSHLCTVVFFVIDCFRFFHETCKN